MAGLNNWDLINSEGDIRVGNPTYRLKFGVALGGGGAGATGIMQAGGIGTLSLGAAGKYLVQLNGSSNSIDLLNLIGGLRIAGNVGIGTTQTSAPLNFANQTGNKIAIFGDAAVAHYGIGLQSALMQFYTDLPGSDIAFGYGRSAAFTERLRIKGNGAIALSGNSGTVNQVITSNGAGSAANWQTASKVVFKDIVQLVPTVASSITLPKNDTYITIPGMLYGFSVAGNAKIFVHLKLTFWGNPCAFCPQANIWAGVYVNNVLKGESRIWVTEGSGFKNTLSFTTYATVPQGSHNIEIRVRDHTDYMGGPVVFITSTSVATSNNMVVEVIND
ncbi:MAG TPA: hypothetical protein VK907_06330 [Phnomibacter sp.]|nr:hypothetical protein [Phnomibacter sp.]